MSDEVSVRDSESAHVVVGLFKERSKLRKQLAFTEGYAALLALFTGSARASDGALFWALVWTLMAVLLAANCVLDARDYRREKAWRVTRRTP